MWRLSLPLFVMLLSASVAQGDDTVQKNLEEDTEAPYQSGYGDTPGFGGPSSVSEELRESNKTRVSTYQSDSLQRAFGPWFDWKRQLNEN